VSISCVVRAQTCSSGAPNVRACLKHNMLTTFVHVLIGTCDYVTYVVSVCVCVAISCTACFHVHLYA